MPRLFRFLGDLVILCNLLQCELSNPRCVYGFRHSELAVTRAQRLEKASLTALISGLGNFTQATRKRMELCIAMHCVSNYCAELERRNTYNFCLSPASIIPVVSQPCPSKARKGTIILHMSRRKLQAASCDSRVVGLASSDDEVVVRRDIGPTINTVKTSV